MFLQVALVNITAVKITFGRLKVFILIYIYIYIKIMGMYNHTAYSYFYAVTLSMRLTFSVQLIFWSNSNLLSFCYLLHVSFKLWCLLCMYLYHVICINYVEVECVYLMNLKSKCVDICIIFTLEINSYISYYSVVLMLCIYLFCFFTLNCILMLFFYILMLFCSFKMLYYCFAFPRGPAE